jgi:hypothetical protein
LISSFWKTLARWYWTVRGRAPSLCLIYFNEAGEGGHFAAWEQPQLFSEEIRSTFRPLR